MGQWLVVARNNFGETAHRNAPVDVDPETPFILYITDLCGLRMLY